MKNHKNNQWIWGFTHSAENWNGRLAMIAFILIFLYELYNSKNLIYNLDIR